jgi:hypothetical protein
MRKEFRTPTGARSSLRKRADRLAAVKLKTSQWSSAHKPASDVLSRHGNDQHHDLILTVMPEEQMCRIQGLGQPP